MSSSLWYGPFPAIFSSSNPYQALGYIHREILTGLFVLGAFWPLTCGISFLRSHVFLSLLWFLSCLAMSTFTLLSALKVENIPLM